MKKAYIYLILTLLFIIPVLAQVPCSTDDDCIYTYGSGSYCDTAAGTCVFPEPITPSPALQPTLPSTHPASSGTATIASLQLQLNTLQASFEELRTRIETLEADDVQIQSKLTQIESNMRTLSVTLENIRSTEINAVSTGLAGLQKDINVTSTQVNAIQQDIKTEVRSQILTYILVIILILAVCGGIIYYLYSGKWQRPKLTKEALAYITERVREGKKYSHIKEKLIQAGWPEKEIEWAYKEVMRHNYNKFLGKQLVKPASASSITAAAPKVSAAALPDNRTKIIVIIGISIILILGVLFALSRTSGQAIYFEKLVGGSTNATSGEVTYTVQCTPPHILNPERVGCCLDNNNNTVCDNLENVTQTNETLAVGIACRDNRQCGNNLCINGKCAALTSIYQTPIGGSGCSKVCNAYALTVSTSDRESYTLRPREGSYTAAGALDWTILAAPNHCIEESVVIPIEITRKKTREVINTKVITLANHQTSQAITHPYAPGLAFTLKIDDTYELCAANENDLRIEMEKQRQLRSLIEVKS